jgi:plastocyanin
VGGGTGGKWTSAVYFADVVPSQTITIFILCCKQNSSYFYPQNITVFIGLNNTVRWFSSSGSASVTANDGSFSTGTFMDPNLSRSITLSTPGTYPYRNTVGYSLGGTIRVVSAIVVTTTKTYLFTTTSSSATTLTNTATITTTEATTATVTAGSATDLRDLQIFTVTAIAVTAVASAWVGSRLRSRGRT